MLASALLHWEALRDHVAGWRFLMKHDTVEISPLDLDQDRRSPVIAIANAVDNEERLVVLSAGREQDVKQGDTFLLFRESQPVGLVRVPELSGARIVWSKAGSEVRKGDRASSVSLVHALANEAGIPVIQEAASHERPWRCVESLRGQTVLEILRETGWRIVEQRLPRRAYIVLGAGADSR